MAIMPLLPLNVTLQNFNIMSGLFRQGWSANKVQSYMTDFVIGYRRSTVQEVRRVVLDVVKKERYIKALMPTERPTKGMLVEMNWDSPYRYKVFGSWTVFDEETGEYYPESWSTYFAHLPTTQEVREDLQSQFLSDKYKETLHLDSIEIRQYQHKKGKGY